MGASARIAGAREANVMAEVSIRPHDVHAGTTAAHRHIVAPVIPWSPGTDPKRIVANVVDHHISGSRRQRLAAPEPMHMD